MSNEIKHPYVPAGQRPMRNLRKHVKDAGFLLPLGPATAKRKPRAVRKG